MKQCHAVAFLLPASTSQVKILIRSLLTRHPLVMLVTAFLTISLSEKHCSFQEPEVQYQYCHYTDIELSECYASGESFGAYRP